MSRKSQLRIGLMDPRNDLQAHWNHSMRGIPVDRDPSAYAITTEKHFPRHAAVCDVGGGSGTDSLYFAAHGHRVTIVDISDVALQRAREAAVTRDLTKAIETLPCDLNAGSIPVATASHDVVYSRLALHYFEPTILAKLFGEIYRILKPGGKAYLTLKAPGPQEMAHFRSDATETSSGVFNDGGYIKTRFTADQLAEILRLAGIDDKEFTVTPYVEHFEGRKDRVKSGQSEMLLNEVTLAKSMDGA
jgi:SAM-dependent methyltransferase